MEWGGWAIRKVFGTDNQHQLSSLFRGPEVPAIVHTIKDIVARYCSTASGIEIMRIGFSSNIVRPPNTVIITVKPNTVLSWDQGCALAREVLDAVEHTLLVDFNLDLKNIQCEIFETLLNNPWAASLNPVSETRSKQ